MTPYFDFTSLFEQPTNQIMNYCNALEKYNKRVYSKNCPSYVEKTNRGILLLIMNATITRISIKELFFMNGEVNDQNASNCVHMRWGAGAFFVMPLCYIVMFLIFGVALSFPQTESVSDKIVYIYSQQSILSFAYIVGYLVFGSVLLLAVQATHTRLSVFSSHLLNAASAFGFIWVVFMFGSGMVALVGMNTMLSLFSKGSPHADTLFYIYTTVVNGLGGGIELVGALWVLLMSIHGLKTGQLAKGLHLLGLSVGAFGVLTLFQSMPIMKEAFGLSQIVWFIWMGFSLLKSNAEHSK